MKIVTSDNNYTKQLKQLKNIYDGYDFYEYDVLINKIIILKLKKITCPCVCLDLSKSIQKWKLWLRTINMQNKKKKILLVQFLSWWVTAQKYFNIQIKIKHLPISLPWSFKNWFKNKFITSNDQHVKQSKQCKKNIISSNFLVIVCWLKIL